MRPAGQTLKYQLMYNYKPFLPDAVSGGGGFVSDSSLGGAVSYGGGQTENIAGQDIVQQQVTAGQIAEIIGSALSSLRVYVVESDITNAQNNVRAIVEESVF